MKGRLASRANSFKDNILGAFGHHSHHNQQQQHHPEASGHGGQVVGGAKSSASSSPSSKRNGYSSSKKSSLSGARSSGAESTTTTSSHQGPWPRTTTTTVRKRQTSPEALAAAKKTSSTDNLIEFAAPKCADSLVREIQLSLRYYEDAVAKGTYDMLPGCATVVLNAVAGLQSYAVGRISTALSTANSLGLKVQNEEAAVFAALDAMYSSVAKLTQWADRVIVEGTVDPAEDYARLVVGPVRTSVMALASALDSLVSSRGAGAGDMVRSSSFGEALDEVAAGPPGGSGGSGGGDLEVRPQHPAASSSSAPPPPPPPLPPKSRNNRVLSVKQDLRKGSSSSTTSSSSSSSGKPRQQQQLDWFSNPLFRQEDDDAASKRRSTTRSSRSTDQAEQWVPAATTLGSEAPAATAVTDVPDFYKAQRNSVCEFLDEVVVDVSPHNSSSEMLSLAGVQVLRPPAAALQQQTLFPRRRQSGSTSGESTSGDPLLPAVLQMPRKSLTSPSSAGSGGGTSSSVINFAFGRRPSNVMHQHLCQQQQHQGQHQGQQQRQQQQQQQQLQQHLQPPVRKVSQYDNVFASPPPDMFGVRNDLQDPRSSVPNSKIQPTPPGETSTPSSSSSLQVPHSGSSAPLPTFHTFQAFQHQQQQQLLQQQQLQGRQGLQGGEVARVHPGGGQPPPLPPKKRNIMSYMEMFGRSVLPTGCNLMQGVAQTQDLLQAVWQQNYHGFSDYLQDEETALQGGQHYSSLGLGGGLDPANCSPGGGSSYHQRLQDALMTFSPFFSSDSFSHQWGHHHPHSHHHHLHNRRRASEFPFLPSRMASGGPGEFSSSGGRFRGGSMYGGARPSCMPPPFPRSFDDADDDGEGDFDDDDDHDEEDEFLAAPVAPTTALRGSLEQSSRISSSPSPPALPPKKNIRKPPSLARATPRGAAAPRGAATPPSLLSLSRGASIEEEGQQQILQQVSRTPQGKMGERTIPIINEKDGSVIVCNRTGSFDLQYQGGPSGVSSGSMAGLSDDQSAASNVTTSSSGIGMRASSYLDRTPSGALKVSSGVPQRRKSMAAETASAASERSGIHRAATTAKILSSDPITGRLSSSQTFLTSSESSGLASSLVGGGQTVNLPNNEAEDTAATTTSEDQEAARQEVVPVVNRSLRQAGGSQPEGPAGGSSSRSFRKSRKRSSAVTDVMLLEGSPSVLDQAEVDKTSAHLFIYTEDNHHHTSASASGPSGTSSSSSGPVKDLLRAGIVDALIVLATQSHKNDFLYQEAFLCTYRTFVSSHDLLDKLVYRFRRFSSSGKKKAKKGSFFGGGPARSKQVEAAPDQGGRSGHQEVDCHLHQKVARCSFSLLVRVVDGLIDCDFEDTSVMELLTDFMAELVADGELILVRALRSKFSQKLEEHRSRLLPDLDTSALSLSHKPSSSLLHFKSIELAEQMTLLDAQLFMRLDSSELILWVEEQNEDKSPNLTRFTEHFNNMSYWCRTKILQHDDSKDREKLVMKFIKIMKWLRKYNNFNSYLALLSALDSAPIRRLEWQRSITEGLKEYCALIDSSSSFRAYRNALSESTPPCIPYVGLVLQDLTFVHIGNSDSFDGKVNFSKRWQQFNILDNLRRFKKETYPFKRKDDIIHFFGNFENYWSEDQMWTVSEKIKPRGKK